MLPWLFLEPDALCYLPVRPTNSGCCLCVLLDVWAGLFMFIWAHQKVRKHFFNFFFQNAKFLSGPQQPPGGSGAAPGLSGGQEDQGTECRHQVDIFISCLLSGFPGNVRPRSAEGPRIRNILNCVFQSVHPVQRRLVSLLHRHVLQPHGREGEAAGPGGGAGQTAGSQGNGFCALIPAHL